MTRPIRNPNIPNAYTRMENAVWTLLAQKPYKEIRVNDILHVAKTTKTTFYYHFASLHDLTMTTIAEEVSRDEALQMANHLLAQAYREVKIDLSHLFDNEPFHRRLERFTLLAGSHGTPELSAILKDFLRTFISTVIDTDIATLKAEDRAAIEFMLGGMIALLAEMANCPDAIPTSALITVMNDEINALLTRFSTSNRIAALSTRQDTAAPEA